MNTFGFINVQQALINVDMYNLFCLEASNMFWVCIHFLVRCHFARLLFITRQNNYGLLVENFNLYFCSTNIEIGVTLIYNSCSKEEIAKHHVYASYIIKNFIFQVLGIFVGGLVLHHFMSVIKKKKKTPSKNLSHFLTLLWVNAEFLLIWPTFQYMTNN